MYGLFSDDSDFLGFWYAQPGYVSGLYLLLLAVFKVAPTTLIFSTWTTL